MARTRHGRRFRGAPVLAGTIAAGNDAGPHVVRVVDRVLNPRFRHPLLGVFLGNDGFQFVGLNLDGAVILANVSPLQVEI